MLSFPRVCGLFQNGDSGKADEKKTVLIADETETDKNQTLALFQAGLADKEVVMTDKSIDDLTALIEKEEYDSALVITSPTAYTYIVKSAGMYDQTEALIEEIMLTKYQSESMEMLGVSVGQAKEILTAEIKGELIQTGKDQVKNFFYTYILIFVLYIEILFYGQFVATSVATEKSSRAMELLITSAKPENLMFGKVIGLGLAGLLLLYSIFNMPVSMLFYIVLFFLLGYFVYSFLYGAVGSLASRLEDINTSVMPITVLFIIAFFIVMFSVSGGNVNSTLMAAASFVPFTSPMAMFARIAMGEVAALEIVVSVVILLISIVGIGIFSAKIYKVGVLLYGTPPKLSSIVKTLKGNSGCAKD